MKVNRREFLAAGGVLSGAICANQWGLSAWGGQGGSIVRVRKDVATLTASSPEILSLKKGVAAMKALGLMDLRNWRRQAEIHGTILGAFGNCQHGNWWFLPWHRVYLYYFEEIIRQLSGDDDFALPYWDWSKDFSVPGLFWGQDNPLANPARSGEVGSGRNIGPDDIISDANQRRFVNQTVISGILRSPDFAVFAGEAAAMLGDGPGQGRLEGGPHNFIHNWIGGDMQTGGSPYDPIFWLHHCNVDRLWTEWVRRHPDGMPNDQGWLGTKYAGHFCDRNGQSITSESTGAPISAARVLNTDEIGYRYDRRTSAIPFNLANASDMRLLAGPVLSRANAQFADRAVDFKTASNEEFSGQVSSLADRDKPYSVRLRLKDVKIPKDRNVAVDVYFNCLKASKDLTITDSSYAGSVTFFHGSHEGSHGGATFLMDVSPVVARLYADRPFKPDEPIKVTLVTSSLNEAEPWTGSVQELAPQQVSIELVGPKND